MKGLLVCAGITLFCVSVLALVAYDAGIIRERGKATEAGVGYYKVDPQTGDTEFVYGVKGAGDERQTD